VTPGRALVLVPTYDECDNIGPLIARIRASVPAADVLVIDDASPDGTGKLVAELATTDPHVHLLSRPEKQGLGAAYRAGYGWGMARGYDVFVQMDADGSHAPEQLPDLLAALDAADLVLGSRWVPGGAVVNWPRYREALSRAGNAYTRLLLGLPVRDATGGYRALRRGTVECLELEEVASAGYCFQVDVVHRALRAGCEVVEVPIRFVERQHGVSKMNGAVVREALWRVTAWGLRRRLGAARDVLSKATGGSMRSEP
jgi:dolichol-phosphate mannosyltransferase